MAYYSLKDPIYNNDVINKEHNLMAHAVFRRKKLSKSLFFLRSSVQVQAFIIQAEKRTSL